MRVGGLGRARDGTQQNTTEDRSARRHNKSRQSRQSTIRYNHAPWWPDVVPLARTCMSVLRRRCLSSRTCVHMAQYSMHIMNARLVRVVHCIGDRLHICILR